MRRMQQAHDLGALLQPARNGESGLDSAGRAAPRACAGRAGRDRRRRGRRTSPFSRTMFLRSLTVAAVGRNRAEHHVGMAADIFGAGLDGEIDAVVERTEVERARPGVVHEHERALRVRRAGDGGDVLHFEAQRARRFQIDGARVLLHQRGDSGPDERIVVGGGDAEPGEDLVAKRARRPIGAVGDEDVVAGMHDRQQRRRDRRKPGRQQRHAGALRAFELLQREFERLGRRRAAAPVLIARAVGDIVRRGADRARSRRDRPAD